MDEEYKKILRLAETDPVRSTIELIKYERKKQPAQQDIITIPLLFISDERGRSASVKDHLEILKGLEKSGFLNIIGIRPYLDTKEAKLVDIIAKPKIKLLLSRKSVPSPINLPYMDDAGYLFYKKSKDPIPFKKGHAPHLILRALIDKAPESIGRQDCKIGSDRELHNKIWYIRDACQKKGYKIKIQPAGSGKYRLTI